MTSCVRGACLVIRKFEYWLVRSFFGKVVDEGRKRSVLRLRVDLVVVLQGPLLQDCVVGSKAQRVRGGEGEGERGDGAG